MQWLDEQGFEAVTLDQVEEAWYEGGRLPPAPIVISFDDGYPSQYATAFEVLRGLEWPGVLNLSRAAPSCLTPMLRECSTPAGSWPRRRPPTSI